MKRVYEKRWALVDNQGKISAVGALDWSYDMLKHMVDHSQMHGRIAQVEIREVVDAEYPVLLH